MFPEYWGLQKTSLIDFPGEVCSVLFTSGCNLRCPYCHNPELATGRIPADFVSRETVLSHLSKRRKVLSGVCVTGGEPLLRPGLGEMVKEIRGMGLRVKIDTNGLLAERLFSLSPDFIAMDLKTSPARYRMLGYTGDGDTASIISGSVRMLIDSGIPHQFRLTLVPGVTGREEVETIASLLPGGETLVVSQFRPDVTLSQDFSTVIPYTETAAFGLLSSLREKKINVKMLGFK